MRGEEDIVSEENVQSLTKVIEIIDDFKPWAIGSQEAMLLEMYEKIFYNTNDRKILYSEKKILKNISFMLLFMHKFKII